MCYLAHSHLAVTVRMSQVSISAYYALWTIQLLLKWKLLRWQTTGTATPFCSLPFLVWVTTWNVTGLMLITYWIKTNSTYECFKHTRSLKKMYLLLLNLNFQSESPSLLCTYFSPEYFKHPKSFSRGTQQHRNVDKAYSKKNNRYTLDNLFNNWCL